MKKSAVIAHFGSVQATADALEVTRQAVNQWPDVVARGIAYEVQAITRGKLMVDRDVYRRMKAKQSRERARA